MSQMCGEEETTNARPRGGHLDVAARKSPYLHQLLRPMRGRSWGRFAGKATPHPTRVPPQRPGETPEVGRNNMLGADLRSPRRRLSSGPGLGWACPEPLDPGAPLPPRPTTLPLLIPPRISITRAEADR